MGVIDNILGKFDLKYEDLKPMERETLMSWIDQLDNNQLTLEKVRSYVHTLRDQTEQQLVNEPEFIWIFIFKFMNRKQIFLKAKLQNLMLLDSFMSSPDKARANMEQAIGSIVKDKQAM